MHIGEQTYRLHESDRPDSMLCLSDSEGHVRGHERRLRGSTDTDPLHPCQREDIQVLRRSRHRRVIIRPCHEIVTQSRIILRPHESRAGTQQEHDQKKASSHLHIHITFVLNTNAANPDKLYSRKKTTRQGNQSSSTSSLSFYCLTNRDCRNPD